MTRLFHHAKKSKELRGHIAPKDVCVPMNEGVKCLYCGCEYVFSYIWIEEDDGWHPCLIVRDSGECGNCAADIQTYQYCDLEDISSNLMEKVGLLSRNRRKHSSRASKPWYDPNVIKNSPYIKKKYSDVSYDTIPEFEIPFDNFCYLHNTYGYYVDEEFNDSYMPEELIFFEEAICPGDVKHEEFYTEHPMWKDTTFLPEDIDKTLLSKVELVQATERGPSRIHMTDGAPNTFYHPNKKKMSKGILARIHNRKRR